MVPDPWWGLEMFLTGAPRSAPFVKFGPGMTYVCRQGQIRGKAAKKSRKKAAGRLRRL